MADDLAYMDSNIIDFSLLSSPSPTVAAIELSKLMAYITNWGVFQIINIGLSAEFLDVVLDVSKQFFTLPFEDQKKYLRTADNPQGFAIDGDPENPSEACNRLFLLLSPEREKRPERWPETPQEFRETMHEFAKPVEKAHDGVMRAMARALGIEEGSFIEGYGENPQLALRINYYPPSPRVDAIRQVSRHADAGAMTFLLIDREVEALEVLKDDQWFKVPIIPHAIVVLVGDQIEIMSNGIVKSVEHRVKPNSNKVRISTALFHSPDLEKEVGPLKALVTEDRPPLYKTVKSYINLFDDHFLKGVRTITAVKI